MYERELRRVAAATSHYLGSLSTRPVSPSPDALERLETLVEPLPDAGTPIDEIHDLLDGIIGPATMATAGPRFFGFVTGGCHPAALIANWFAGAWDQNVLLSQSTPAGVAIESLVLDWLLELLGLPKTTGGALVTGATMANVSALAAARGELLRRAGWDLAADGLSQAPRVTIVISDEAHPTIDKALRLLGFGRRAVTRIPTDGQGRMRPDRLPGQTTGPTLLILQAGNVNTGAYDPAADLIEWGRGQCAWIHVDGAFGLWGVLAESVRTQVEPFLLADSWALDAHKWLNVPYDSGIALVRDSEALRRAFAIDAPYLPRTAVREPMHYTPDTSRRFRAIEIWSVLKALGRSGVAAMIERNCEQARTFARALEASGFRILNDVVANQVLVDFGSEKKTLAVIQEIQSEGVCWCGPTRWQGQVAMRISVSSWRTQDEDVRESIEAVVRAACQVDAKC